MRCEVSARASARRIRRRACQAIEADLEMAESTEVRPIDPKVLAELAERALKQASKIKNPYVRALMARFGRTALELKAALESEARS